MISIDILVGKSDNGKITDNKIGRGVVIVYVSDWNDDFESIKVPNWF